MLYCGEYHERKNLHTRGIPEENRRRCKPAGRLGAAEAGPAGRVHGRAGAFLFLAEAEHILKLEQLGYAAEEIEKIIKKIGLPRAGASGKERREPEKILTVGALAERAGISPRTIKHWEELLKKNKKEIQNLRGNARSAREKKGKAVA